MSPEASSAPVSSTDCAGVFLKHALRDGIDFETQILPVPNGVLASGLPVLCELVRIDALTEAGLVAMLAAGADIMAADTQGNTALAYALRFDRDDMFYALMQNGGIEHINRLHDGGAAKQTLLHIAVARQRTGPAAFLIEIGANVNATDAAGASPLLLAVRNLDFDMARELIAYGADVVAYEQACGQSLVQELYHAALKDESGAPCEEKLLRLLLDCGANPDSAGQNGPAITGYAQRGRHDFVKIILDAGGNPDAGRGSTFYTRPLDHAMRQENPRLVEMLLKAGANPNLSTATNALPLVRASMDKRIDLIDMVVQYGGDPNFEGSNGMTVLCAVLSAQSDIEVLSALIGHGANVDKPCRSINYTYPLHMAVKRGDVNIVNLLLKNGADPLVVSKACETPWQLAQKMHGADHPVTARLKLAEDAARIKPGRKPAGPKP